MSVSPASRIVSRGRPSADDIEARHPLGRWIHGAEGFVYGAARVCLLGRNAHPVWASHDRLADAAVADTRVCARELLTHDDPVVRAWGIRILGNCGDYDRADRAEDACTLSLFGLFAEIHGFVRQLGAALERLAGAVRGAKS